MSKLRLLFIKEAQASYISHLDLLRSTLADDVSPACPRRLLDGNPRRILEDRPMVGADRPISSPREDEL